MRSEILSKSNEMGGARMPRIFSKQERELMKKMSLALAVMMGVGIVHANQPSRQAQDQPNIIYIMSDDWGIGKVNSYKMCETAQRIIKTPNLDKLAADGMRFVNGYSGGVICSPSRSVLLSGRHMGHSAWRHNCGLYPLKGKMSSSAKYKALEDGVPGAYPTPDWPQKEPMLGDVARKAGYKAAAFGKLSAGGSQKIEHISRQGWDYWLGFGDHALPRDYYAREIYENGTLIPIPGNKAIEKYLATTMLPPKGNRAKAGQQYGNGVVGDGKGTFMEDLYADKVIEFMTNHKDEPFFVYLASSAPHGGSPGGMRVPTIAGYDQYDELSQREKVYCALMTHHDRNIGRIRKAVEDLGLAENTIIIWTTDNGDCRSYYYKTNTFDGNGPFRMEKGSIYEGGIRVPLIAWWPGHIEPGSVCDLPTSMQDIMPTVADAGGQPITEHMDGISILPTLRGTPEKQTPREYLYWETLGVWQAVRMGNWKAVRKDGPGNPVELYQLDQDIGEEWNVAAEHPEVVSRIEAIMQTEHEPHPYWMFPDEIPEGELSPAQAQALPKQLKIKAMKEKKKKEAQLKKKESE
jgi:arylsulfatase A